MKTRLKKAALLICIAALFLAGSAKIASQALDHIIEEHVHSAAKVYPTLADGVNVVGDAVAWTLGTIVEIVPADTITRRFDIHWLCICSLDANGTYEIVLYYGPTDIEAGRVRVVKNAVQDGTMNIPFQTPVIPANSRIRAKQASDTGGDTSMISIMYHEYD